jgi:acyl carrier protein
LHTVTTDDLLELARSELARLQPSANLSRLTPATSISSLGIESVTLIEFVCAIEERYEIVIPDDELTEIDSLLDLEKIVSRHIPAET